MCLVDCSAQIGVFTRARNSHPLNITVPSSVFRPCAGKPWAPNRKALWRISYDHHLAIVYFSTCFGKDCRFASKWLPQIVSEVVQVQIGQNRLNSDLWTQEEILMCKQAWRKMLQASAGKTPSGNVENHTDTHVHSLSIYSFLYLCFYYLRFYLCICFFTLFLIVHHFYVQ